jgi:hypothetical protein
MSNVFTIPSNTTVIPVNLSSFSKIAVLPVANQHPGRLLIFKDMFGNAARSTLTLSTTSANIVERTSQTSLVLSNAFGAWSLLSDGNTRWILTNVYSNNFPIIP